MSAGSEDGYFDLHVDLNEEDVADFDLNEDEAANLDLDGSAAYFDLDGDEFDHTYFDMDTKPHTAKEKTKFGSGFVRGSAAWGAAMAAKRWEKQKPDDAFSKVANAFDNTVLRVGDQIQKSEAEPDRTWRHGNTYTVLGPVKQAVREIGKGYLNVRGCCGIDSGRRRMQSLVTLAGMTQRLFKRAAHDLQSKWCSELCAAEVICRHFDTTPIFFRFGELQSMVSEQAKYLKLSTRLDPHTGISYPTWTTILYAQCVKENPKASCSAGVFNVHGQHCSVTRVQCTTADDFQQMSQEFILPPRIVQNTTGSTAFSAVNSGCTPISNESAKAISQHTSCVIVDDTPDGCGAMLRYKHAAAEAFAQVPNIFYNEHGSCGP